MNEHIERLKNILGTILEEPADFLPLKNALEDYKALLLDLSKLDLYDDSNKTYLEFENGVAIGPTWAARCLDEIMRTRQFIRGIYTAIEELVHNRNGEEPIQIFYAGSGPFATLMLPVITAFTAEEIQIRILEVNPISAECIKQVLSKLGFDKYVVSIECEDASKYKVEEEVKIDLLISETMQYGLVKEQQVSIMLNLVNQLDEDVIIIPQTISLELGFLNSGYYTNWEEGKKEKFKGIGKLLDFNKNYITSYLKSIEEGNGPKKVVEKSFALPKWSSENYDSLVVLTEIQVYGKEKIGYKECGLTLPYSLNSTSRIEEGASKMDIWYEMEALPRWEYEVK